MEQITVQMSSTKAEKDKMKNGKVSQTVLKRSVLKQLNSENEAVLSASGVGLDYAAFCTGSAENGPAVISATASVTAGEKYLAERTVSTAVNNVAVSGAEPVGIQVALTVPTLWNEAQVRELMRDVDVSCREEGIRVLGGHTQVSRRVKDPVLSVTAMGILSEAKKRISNAGAEPGMDILLTKWIGMEGTALLAEEREGVLRERFSHPFLEQAKAFRLMHGIRQEATVAANAGASAMHDVSEGGIFGALWEFAEASGIGLEIDLKRIPIRQETVEITEVFDINPYKLLSGGSLLIAARDGNAIKRELEKAGIPAEIIGKATNGNDRVLLHDGERRFLETVQTDEIYKVFED